MGGPRLLHRREAHLRMGCRLFLALLLFVVVLKLGSTDKNNVAARDSNVPILRTIRDAAQGKSVKRSQGRKAKKKAKGKKKMKKTRGKKKTKKDKRKKRKRRKNLRREKKNKSKRKNNMEKKKEKK